MYSRFGPAVAKGDLTGNGLDDIIVGGAMGFPSAIFYQTKLGEFYMDTTELLAHKYFEDAGIAIFDIDKDGKNDIFIASGGNEYPQGNKVYTPRYYLNKGNRQFESLLIPFINQSSSVVRNIEIEGENFVFLGARLQPWNYPLSPKSYLLSFQNNKW